MIPIVEERILVGKRDVERGRVRVRSYVVETPVTEQVTLREEHVDVQRRVVDRPLTDADEAFRERVIDATEHAEEAVIAKEARVTEETQEFATVPTVPCGEEHDSEIYAAHDLEGAEYPGDEAVVTGADELCLDDFASFVGTAYEESALELTTFFPSADSWDLQDDREVLCVVVDVDGGVTGTLEGAQY